MKQISRRTMLGTAALLDPVRPGSAAGLHRGELVQELPLAAIERYLEALRDVVQDSHMHIV